MEVNLPIGFGIELVARSTIFGKGFGVCTCFSASLKCYMKQFQISMSFLLFLISTLIALLSVGQVDARFQGTRPLPISKIQWHLNDSHTPDTHALLTLADTLEKDAVARYTKLSDDERFIVCNTVMAANFSSSTLLMMGVSANVPDIILMLYK